MRITNKIIQNNSSDNINLNKVYQDKLNNQMATQKKIVRPSDDPVVAIRALRLRTNVSQITQYYEKNVPDANSWLEVTESALTTVSTVVTDMQEQCTKGASEKLTATDRQTILDALTALKDEVYSTGDADYAGRSVFTGYRTESTLRYKESAADKFRITEQVNTDIIDSITYVNSNNINSLNEGNYDTTANAEIKETQITATNIKRIRLAYDNVSDTVTPLPVVKTFDHYDADGKPVYTEQYGAIEVISNTETGDDNPYAKMAAINATTPVEQKMILIPETGELLLSDSVYKSMVADLSDDATTSTVDESQIQITYDKNVWKKNDLRPEHYFACTKNPDVAADKIEYNSTYLQGKVEKQAIEYDVGVSQTIRVNTTADEVFTHAIGRDVEDMISVLNDTIEMEETIARLEKIKSGLTETDPGYDIVTNQIDAANKSLTYLNERRQKLFESSITKMQKHLDKTNEATTACGTRGKKLELIKNRLMSQQTNFKTLESENENVDISDVAIELKSATMTYDAALMSVGKILQTSLMNYI